MNSVPAIDTEVTGNKLHDPAAVAGWLCGLLQTGDSFYPTGSYAHSFGLEGLVLEGAIRDRDSLRRFVLQSALPSLERSELPLVAHAWQAVAVKDWPKLREISVISSAVRTAREARLASESIGRQRAELAAALHPQTVANEYWAQATAGQWPFAAVVSAAVEAHALGAPLDAALASYTYSAVGSLIAAAMKLLRLGQNGAQSLLAEALREGPRLIAAAQTVPLEQVGWFNPWLDIAAARHETADARMFIS